MTLHVAGTTREGEPSPCRPIKGYASYLHCVELPAIAAHWQGQQSSKGAKGERLEMRNRLILIVLVLSVGGTWLTANGQPNRGYTTRSKRAIENYKEAVTSFELGDYGAALNNLSRAKRADGRFIEAYLLEAQVHEQLGNYTKAYELNLAAHAIDTGYFALTRLFAGRCALKAGMHEQAIMQLERYLGRRDVPPYRKMQAEQMLRSAQFARYAVSHPIRIAPEPLPPTVNSVHDAYFPSLSADELTLTFTKLMPLPGMPISRNRNYMQEDLYIAHRASTDSSWGKAEAVDSPVTTPEANEGAQSLTADGKRMYFTKCEGYCNIYYSDKNSKGEWSQPRALPSPINLAKSSDKQPSISSDGHTLYFASNRSGGRGGYDLWRATLDPINGWTKVENLGDTINTPGDEQSPFIHFDNQTLYFSSNWHPGIGAQDVFVSRRVNKKGWTIPKNLGYPLNTPYDDIGLIVSPRARDAYYASNRRSEMGLDLYTFEMPDSLRPVAVSYVKAQAIDAKTKYPIPAECQLIALSTGDTLMSPNADANGEFLVCLPMGERYGLFASHEGYLDYSEHFDFKKFHNATAPLELHFAMTPIAVGNTITLRNVFFELNSDSLARESYHELNRLVSTMRRYPKMRVQIEGHTDNSGTPSYNLELSKRRAISVRVYLSNAGIATDRIECVGFGQTRPAADNTTEAGRAANRRTECRIIAL